MPIPSLVPPLGTEVIMSNKTYHYDFGNMCQMFNNILSDILVSLQDENIDKATDKTNKGIHWLKEWKLKYLAGESVKNEP